MDILTQLAIRYKTDKWGKHHYTPIYYNLFKDKRYKVEKVLEIGAGEGYGLRMFRDFFPNAIIYGAEIDEKRIFTEDRIKVIKCDQSKREDLVNLFLTIGLDLDLVIDDGSHKLEDQISTCLSITKHLKKRCIYIIEDVADERVYQEIKKFYPKAELKQVGKRYDDQLIIIHI